ncbi:MAG: DUF3566 domain-containing protein [Fidelibacterota bacterium]|nr:MAG: DUF3566 domain-containing protein [Candidatus Neomarinimicrobiota bacterium]
MIKEIQVWSVARTVFPLAWIVCSIVIFCVYLLIGSLLTNLVDEFAEMPVIDQGVGIGAGILFSLAAGFLSTIATTLIAVLVAVVYNLLVALGGGVSVGFSESALATEPARDKPGEEKEEAS